MKDCNNCSMCCKLPEYRGLKAYGVWCPHADPKCYGRSCKIYEKRPQGCKDFNCLWRTSAVLKEDMRPCKCGIVFEVFEPEKFILAMVDNHKSEAWKKKGPAKVINSILKDGYFVWITTGKQRHLLLPKGIRKQQALELTEKAYMRKMRLSDDGTKLHRGLNRPNPG